ncbi:hypothetical protein [Pseudomonas sp. TCU-HL1]|uniref:hypothetical protein n=1 Tax=Pseudomonas sp. TCU-HL1 TaxID=1856685 RepID=UPI0009F43432|nr:hypothetical protein [Pseudomonas sp. TCU-HL1]
MKSGADSLPDDPVLLKALVLQLQEQVALLRHKLRIPHPSGHLFHEHPATDFTLIRPPIPRASGH